MFRSPVRNSWLGLLCLAGSWTLSGNKGLSVTQRFDNQSVDFTWLYAHPATLGELEVEVWAHRDAAARGEPGAAAGHRDSARTLRIVDLALDRSKKSWFDLIFND